MCNVAADTVRRDLMYVKHKGRTAAGYEVESLLEALNDELGTSSVDSKLILIGVGNIGQGLLKYNYIPSHVGKIVAAYDVDQKKVGTYINNVPVYDLSSLKKTFPSGCQIAILAIPKEGIDEVVSRLVSLKVNVMFESAYNYIRGNDSHMMKNTEWGAVAYLSLSRFGINKEINVNNNSTPLTGYSATASASQLEIPGISGTDPSLTQPYNTEVGYQASTTGNITGIYDMSGGACEYMAAFVNSTNGSDFFKNIYQENYFDVYNADDSLKTTNFYNRILGDATGEMGPFYNNGNNRPINSWYNDYVIFPNNISYSIFRGGPYNSGSEAGLGYINTYYGDGRNFIGFRLVLSK
jgi:NADH/NAD ratio-sensing transcriptional regulator Rex